MVGYGTDKLFKFVILGETNWYCGCACHCCWCAYLHDTKPEQAPAPESQKREKSVSKGLSEFYRDFRMSATDPQEDAQGDFALMLAGVDPKFR